MYSVKEIPCLESNRVIGVEVKISSGNLYIFSVYITGGFKGGVEGARPPPPKIFKVCMTVYDLINST